jgi:hypothetical protein
MECPMCNHDTEPAFMEENLPCKDCNCINTVTYNMCPQCKCLWRALNGKVIDETIAELGEMVSGIIETPEQLEFFEELKADLHKHIRIQRGKAMMSDFVHRCLRCDSIALPVTDHFYRCNSCGFEWEVFAIE